MILGKYTGLRAVEKSDLEFLKEWRNKESFRKNFREVRELSSYNQEKWYDKLHQSPNDYMFTIVDLQSGKPIGAAGLLYINWIIRAADFSFYIGEGDSYIDDKFAPDAVNSLLNYGYNVLNLNKVWMELYSFDTSKLDFFTKEFNFQVDGKFRQNTFYEGKYHDSFLLSLMADEYRK